MTVTRCFLLSASLVTLLLLSQSFPSSAHVDVSMPLARILSHPLQQEKEPIDGGGRPCCFHNRKFGVQIKRKTGLVPRMFEEWVTSVLHARKALELLENRSGLYVLYSVHGWSDGLNKWIRFHHFRVQKLNPDILNNLFC